MNEFFPSRVGLLAVVGLATLLIGGVVLRSPDTHSNLWNEIRDGYTRTAVGVVAEEGKTAVAEATTNSNQVAMSLQPLLWVEAPKDKALQEITDPGQRLYIASSCARCHGVNGQGGVVGPPLAGQDPALIAAMARLGPQGMPAFSASEIPDGELAKIGAYLSSLKPSVSPRAPAEATRAAAVLPPSSSQVSTPPSPTPKPLPAEASSPAASPSSTSQSGPLSPEPAPVVAVGDAVRGKTVFAGKCAICHGETAKGALGPSLIGLKSDSMEKAVRDGKGGMPRFQASTLGDRELQDIMTYIRSLGSP